MYNGFVMLEMVLIVMVMELLVVAVPCCFVFLIGRGD